MITPKQKEQLRVNPPLYMSAREAAIVVGVCHRTMCDLIKEGQVKVSRVGRDGSKNPRVIVKRTDLELFLNKNLQ